MRTIHAAMLAGCLCCALMPAFAKDAGWQWYNEKLKPHDEERKAAPAAPPPQMDILEKLATLQAATKRSLYEVKTSLSISGCRTTGRSRQVCSR